MRVTAKQLQSNLDRVNEMLGTQFELDNAPAHGGWKLTNGSRVAYHRVSAKEMLTLLEGMSAAFIIMSKMFDLTNEQFAVKDLKKRLASVGLPFDELESGADGVICLAFETDDNEYNTNYPTKIV
tara:strand:+ start:173 stop:547 length:375 start_codon:yes stop_codon:yes gene_type:complete